MIDNDVLAYATLLWSTLIEAAPKDTGNMASKIKMSVQGDQVRIEVSPGVPYALYVNEIDRICKRHHKNHYHWIQAVCKQVGDIYVSRSGGSCKSEYIK